MQNSKLKAKNQNYINRGFTLAEMLVVITILAIAGILVLVIFTQALKGNNKTQVLSSIKKNGQSVLEVMDKTIRNADNVVCPYISVGSTTAVTSNSLVVEKGGVYTRYRLVIPMSPATCTSACSSSCSTNRSIQQDNPTRGVTESITDFANRVCADADPLVSPVTLTDTDLQTGASVCLPLGGYLFTRNKRVGYKDTVTINFQVTAPINAPASVAGQIDPVPFTTAVELR